MTEILFKLENASVGGVEEEDKRIWMQEPHWEFSMASFFRVLNPFVEIAIPTSFLWKSNVPSKVAFFLWLFFFGNAPTEKLLQAMGFSLASRYCVCDWEHETTHV